MSYKREEREVVCGSTMGYKKGCWVVVNISRSGSDLVVFKDRARAEAWCALWNARKDTADIADHEKHFKILELSERLTNKFTANKGNARSMAAHQPIYDRAFSEFMKAMDYQDVFDE